jgi:hypothetical protein
LLLELTRDQSGCYIALINDRFDSSGHERIVTLRSCGSCATVQNPEGLLQREARQSQPIRVALPRISVMEANRFEECEGTKIPTSHSGEPMMQVLCSNGIHGIIDGGPTPFHCVSLFNNRTEPSTRRLLKAYPQVRRLPGWGTAKS